MRACMKLGAAGLQHDRNIRHQLANHLRQFEPGLRLSLAIAGEFDIRDHAQQIVSVLDRQLRPSS